MSWFNLKFYISLSYCLPSFIIYTLLIIMLIRNWKDFKSAFFRIVIADFAFNLLTYLNSMITLRLPNGTCKDCLLSEKYQLEYGKEYSKNDGNFLFLCYFLHFGNAYFQYSMVTLMSLNRFTSIYLIFVNDTIWKFLFPSSIVLMITISVYFTRTILQSSPYFLYNEALDMYSIKADTDILAAYWNVIRFMALAVGLSVLLNCLSVIKLKLMKQKLETVERNLLFATITSSLVQCAAAGNTFLLQVDLTRTSVLGQIAQLMLPFSSDFLTISQPFILIFLSSKSHPTLKMSWFNLKFYISLSYCLPSFIIYTLLIIMLIRNWKDFKSAFFRIVIADFAFNLLTYLNSMITLRLPNGTCKDCLLSEKYQLEYGKEYSKMDGNLFFIFYFLNFANAYFQYSMITLMSLNRFTSLFFFFDNEKIWKFLFPLSIALMITISVYCTRTILQSSPYFVYSKALDMYASTVDTDILSTYGNVIRYMALAVGLSVLLNCLSVIKLKLMKQKLETVERNLLFATITSSIVQCAAAGNTFILQLDPTRTTVLGQIAQLMVPFFSDFLTISQPFILIFLSSKVRMGMISMYFPKTSRIAVVFTSSTAARSRSSQARS